MGVPDWEKVKDIVWQALELEGETRAQYVREMCAGDAELFDEVESLLAAGESDAPLLENQKYNVAAVLTPLSDSELDEGLAGDKSYQGRSFGRYLILREIGRGGMGTVFLAERSDGEFDQQVALKIVRQTIVDAEIERRFRRERQILASLNHPNIAALLDGGVGQEGEPFLVMEYVDGESLLDYADRGQSTIEERLSLFLKVCSAVSYAHRRLVIHRDLKPSNILVTSEGEPKLLDFGLAKILSDNIYASDSTNTATAYRAFTLAYASPEQIRGEQVTTTSDVYSLGVVLYELLTGDRPFHFEKQNYQEVLYSLSNTEPLKPSEVTRRLHAKTINEDGGKTTDVSVNTHKGLPNPQLLSGDIDNIVLKALRKEPDQRYTSIEQLAEDIRRHLKGLPVSARPHTLSYRTAKFFRRNKVAAVAALLVTISLLLGTTISIWQAVTAKKERDRAEKRFNDVRKLSNSLLFELSPKLEQLEGSTEAREILVTRALEYLDSLAQESQNDTGLQSELASAYEKIGDLQGRPQRPNLSDFKGALESYEKARNIRQALFEKNPDDIELRRLQANNIKGLGDIKWWRNDVKGSLENHEEALKIYETLAAQNPDKSEFNIALIDTLIDMGQTYGDNNRFADAIVYLEKAVGKLKEMDAKFPANYEIQRLFGKAYARLGNSLSWEGKQKEAEIEMDKALTINESLVNKFPNEPNLRHGLWVSYMQASSIYEEINNDLSYKYALKSVETMEKMVEKDKSNVQARQNLAKAYSRVGICLSNINKSVEGLAYLEKAKPLYAALEKSEPKNLTYKNDLGRLYVRLGDAKLKLGNLPESLADWEKSVELFEQVADKDSTSVVSMRDLAQSCKNIGDIYKRMAKKAIPAEAETDMKLSQENYERAFDIFSQLKNENAFAEFDQPLFEQIKISLQTSSQSGH